MFEEGDSHSVLLPVPPMICGLAGGPPLSRLFFCVNLDNVGLSQVRPAGWSGSKMGPCFLPLTAMVKEDWVMMTNE